ncbi:YggS family pyridoxal phosphate enzyme [Bacteroidia bacterium]|nr:YggS family pyridoxal phosphate enzyme [Bacteroidia bacterium]GHV08642.1 YggS family pyridoxal phosphate enzyme [Bacteroidia bacterium]
MSITESLQQIKAELPENVQLVAVSKFFPDETILEAYRCGQRIFGENRVQELLPKYEHLPKDIQWHLIGHLQANKVKYITPFVNTIHSIDSLKLIETLNEEAAKCGRKIKILLQVHIALEEHKFGFSFDEIIALGENRIFEQYPHLVFAGLMGMATFTSDEKQIRSEFERLTALFRQLKESYFSKYDDFKELSMGMSDDYPLAVEAGSTMVRIGSKIFGSRKQ